MVYPRFIRNLSKLNRATFIIENVWANNCFALCVNSKVGRAVVSLGTGLGDSG